MNECDKRRRRRRRRKGARDEERGIEKRIKLDASA